MIQARLADDMLADGISVWISRWAEGAPRQILHVAGDNRWTEWDDLDPHGTGEADPTIRLTDEAARALLDALLRHYQGASDMHTVRSDLLAERDRVDRLLGVISQIATSAAAR